MQAGGQTRIVSLIASATEIVWALGMGRHMVGRSHECDHPHEVRQLPQCTSPKFRSDGGSYAIDQRVRAIVQEGLSVYRVDADLLADLRPTHIITQDQCQVCAVSLGDVEEAVCRLTGFDTRVVSLNPDSLADIWEDIRRVGEALAVDREAEQLVARLTSRMGAVSREAERLSQRPRVACIEWIEPLMAAGNWMPELVSLAGGDNLFGEAGKHSPGLSWAALAQGDPDVIVVSPCGFDIGRTVEETGVLERQPCWNDLSAVRSGRVYVADGNQYFNRPGPRVVESLEIMAEMLHPGRLDFGHGGKNWIALRGARAEAR